MMINQDIVVKAIVCVVFIVVSLLLAYKSLDRYLKEVNNHENSFYWGFSFLILGVVNIIKLIGLLFNLSEEWVVLVKILDTLVWWLQLFGISLSIFCRNRCINPEIKAVCRRCLRKKIRVLMWLFLILIFVLCTFTLKGGSFSVKGSMISMMSGNRIFDILISSLQTFISLSIILVLNKTYNFVNMKMAYIGLFIAELIHLTCVVSYGCGSVMLFYILRQVQWAFELVGMVAISTYMYNNQI